MKYFLLFIALLPFTFIYGQKSDNSYIVSNHEEGSLYFILPQSIAKTSKEISKKDFLFDVTYLNSRDSVSYTCTYTTNKEFHSDSISIQSNGQIATLPLETLFIDKKSSSWIHRVRFIIPFDYFEQLYQNDNSYKIIISSKGDFVEYEYKEKKWTQAKAKMNDIITLIKVNKKTLQ